jgi:phosphate transport system protein
MSLPEDLQKLQRSILSMAALCEETIRDAVEHLQKPGEDVQRRLEDYEEQIDRWDVTIENECFAVLERYKPSGRDLRRVATVMKIASELERVADFGVNLAERATELAKGPPLETPPKLHHMAAVALGMLSRAIDAFVAMDVKLAREVTRRDDEVDRLNDELIENLIRQMEKTPHLVRSTMQLFSATRYIERVADHASNIAEYVVFLVDGQIIRHIRS